MDCGVLPAGKPRVACIWKALPPSKQVRPNKPIRISAITATGQRARASLQWWADTLEAKRKRPVWVPWWRDAPVHARTVSDASGTVGFGIVFEDQVIQGTWTKDRSDNPNIAVQELLPMLVALEHIAPQAAGKILILTTDNAGNAFAINKGTCRSPEAFDILFRMLDIAVQYNIYLVGDWIPRDRNPLCDDLSKGVRGVHICT